ncbi:MAG TPA: hypothetical protein P5132_00730 [Bacteroidales bacterium]|nr:hypothetical protein [Bacteroidales bacterium]
MLSILIIVTFFLSCRNKNSLEYIVGQRIGKEMAFPENYTVINDTMNKALTDYESPIQIIYLFNGDCGFCKGSLKKWEDYIVNSAFKEYTDFIFMVYTSNEEFLKDDFQEKILFKQPVFLIDKDVFFGNNGLSDQIISSLTFLIIENKIIAIGNPVYDNESKIIFDEMVLSYLRGEIN